MSTTATVGRIQPRQAGMSILADRTLLRLSAMLLFLGELISLVAGYFHPDQAPANDLHAAFAGYAASVHWTAIHLGQFAGMAVIITGLLTLFFALNVRAGALAWIARLVDGLPGRQCAGRHRLLLRLCSHRGTAAGG